MKLTWRQGQPPPEDMESLGGAVVVHGNTAYFSSGHNVYSYTVPENKWTKLPQCKYERFAMAVINDALTTIGGSHIQEGIDSEVNTLLRLSGSSWEEVLPPMPTEREYPAAVRTPTHLVVAGGRLKGGIVTVEVLNTETLQWSTASSLPEAVRYPQMTTCSGCLYLADDKSNYVFSCSVEDLLKSTNSSDGGSVWTRLASIPVEGSTLATLRGCVLAIGGDDDDNDPTGAIHCYDVATNSWSVIGKIPTPRSQVLAAVLPSNELVVAGGYDTYSGYCSTLEIGSS